VRRIRLLHPITGGARNSSRSFAFRPQNMVTSIGGSHPGT
jgi:hypothetical protein